MASPSRETYSLDTVSKPDEEGRDPLSEFLFHVFGHSEGVSEILRRFGGEPLRPDDNVEHWFDSMVDRLRDPSARKSLIDWLEIRFVHGRYQGVIQQLRRNRVAFPMQSSEEPTDEP